MLSAVKAASVVFDLSTWVPASTSASTRRSSRCASRLLPLTVVRPGAPLAVGVARQLEPDLPGAGAALPDVAGAHLLLLRLIRPDHFGADPGLERARAGVAGCRAPGWSSELTMWSEGPRSTIALGHGRACSGVEPPAISPSISVGLGSGLTIGALRPQVAQQLHDRDADLAQTPRDRPPTRSSRGPCAEAVSPASGHAIVTRPPSRAGTASLWSSSARSRRSTSSPFSVRPDLLGAADQFGVKGVRQPDLRAHLRHCVFPPSTFSSPHRSARRRERKGA